MQLKKIATLSIAAVAALALTACGSDNGTEEPAPAVTAGNEAAPSEGSVPETTPAESTPAETDAPATEGAVEAGSAADAATARNLALAHISTETGTDGIVIDQDLERRDGRWDVDVLAGDTVHEVKVHTVDGTAVTDESEGADGDDRAAAAAAVTIGDAIDAALAHTAGIVDDASWDDDGGGRWEIGVVPSAGGDDVDILVDPTSGEVIGIDN